MIKHNKLTEEQLTELRFVVKVINQIVKTEISSFNEKHNTNIVVLQHINYKYINESNDVENLSMTFGNGCNNCSLKDLLKFAQLEEWSKGCSYDIEFKVMKKPNETHT